ncbi:MAG: S-adenosylmethionine:tRNA ribosyltransferase-isomerase [Bacteroidota bacterium]
MFDPDAIRIADYHYPLPDDLIAQSPLAERDASKLLVHKPGGITQDIFSNIDRYLSSESLLVFNDTRVIRARLIFFNAGGARIEIFCLEPLMPVTSIAEAFTVKSGSTWKCLVGNLKRWKSGPLWMDCSDRHRQYRLSAVYDGDCGDGSHSISFHWEPAETSFSEILGIAGLMPLPPYIHRSTTPEDAERYQTIFASPEGSVAAPTAGLHFTGSVLEKLRRKGISTASVTLHVGVGTFKPVSAEKISDHVMHHERIIVSRDTIVALRQNLGRPLIAVGTTSARTLETLYWAGVKLIRGEGNEKPSVLQWDPYQETDGAPVSAAQALEALIGFLDSHGLDAYAGETQLMIVPGYRYRLLSGLITNFHMPRSTLLLLVAAMVGPGWRQAYDYALANNFRFLSYGDSCLFFNQMTQQETPAMHA